MPLFRARVVTSRADRNCSDMDADYLRALKKNRGDKDEDAEILGGYAGPK